VQLAHNFLTLLARVLARPRILISVRKNLIRRMTGYGMGGGVRQATPPARLKRAKAVGLLHEPLQGRVLILYHAVSSEYP